MFSVTHFDSIYLFSLCSGSSPVDMGHYGTFSGAGLSLPIRQVFTNCGDVRLVLYDSRHDGGPAPCHLLPLAGLPCRGNVPLEHPSHGGLGAGTSAQHTSGREG